MAENSDNKYGGARPKVVKRSRRGHNITHSNMSGLLAGSYTEGDVTVNINQGGDDKKNAEKDSGRFQKWCKNRADKYVRTSLYHQVLTKLGQTKSVLLLADAGDGKSTLLQLVAIQYGEDGFLTLEIDTPADINNYNIDGKNVLFVCDNLLGETNINEHKTEAWKNNESKQFPDSAKFLFACRVEFWGRKKADLNRKQMFNEIVVVRSDKLNYHDKREMLDQHFGNKISEGTKKVIAQKSNFTFPECCRVVSHSLNIDFSDSNKLVEIFSKPLQFVMKQLESLEKNNKLQHAILVFCLINEKEFPKTCRPDVCKESNFEVVRKLYLSDMNCSVEQMYDTLLDNVKQLNGWLLTQEGDDYTFYHDCIFEAMCRLHGDRHPGHILTFCKPEVVFSVFTTNKVSGSDSDRVTLPPHCYPQLVEVVTVECVKEWRWVTGEMWRFVFGHMNTVDILKEWSVCLKRKLSLPEEISPRPFSHEQTEPTLFDVLRLLTEQPDCGLTVDDVFVRSAYHGDLQTSTLALESGVKSEWRVHGLMYAAHQGHNNIVRLTVQRTYPDIEDMSYIEEICEAVSSDRVERVVEMMRSQPDMNTDIQHMVLRWAAEWGHIDVVRVMVQRTDMDMWGIERGLAGAVRCDNIVCLTEILRLHPDIHTDTIHRLLKWAVRLGGKRSVRELLKRPDINKQTIQEMLRKDDSGLFWSWVTQTVRDETRVVLFKHLNPYSEDIESGLGAAVEYDNVEMVRRILRLHPDIDTDTIHRVLKYAVTLGSVRSLRELLKRSDISKRAIQEMLRKDDSGLFWSWVTQTVRDETRVVLFKHLNPYSEDIESGLGAAVEYDIVERVRHILRLHPDIDTDIIHWVLKLAVMCCSVRSVTELLKRPDISKQTIQQMLRKDDSTLFVPWVEQTDRDETRTVLFKHLNPYSEDLESGLGAALEYDIVEMVRQILRVRTDIDTDTIHTVLKVAVRCGSVRIVRELLKRPDISKQTIQEMLRKDDSKLFEPRVTQTVRDEIRTVLGEHLDTGTERIACGLYGAVEHDNVEMVGQILMLHPDITIDTIHTVLKYAVRLGSVRSVRELLKRPDISKQTIRSWLYTYEDELFWSQVTQTGRAETRAVLVKHLKTYS